MRNVNGLGKRSGKRMGKTWCNFAIEKSTAPQPTRVGSQSYGTAEAVVTVNGVSSRSEYVHLRVEPSERKRWKEAAERSGRSLSAMIRDAFEAELERCDHVQAEQMASPSVSSPTSLARAKPLEERPGRHQRDRRRAGLACGLREAQQARDEPERLHSWGSALCRRETGCRSAI
jgi:hypothetical protein